MTMNNKDNQDVFSEDSMRPLFFEAKRDSVSVSTREESVHSKRARLDSAIHIPASSSSSSPSPPSSSSSSASSTNSNNSTQDTGSESSGALSPSTSHEHHRHRHHHHHHRSSNCGAGPLDVSDVVASDIDNLSLVYPCFNDDDSHDPLATSSSAMMSTDNVATPVADVSAASGTCTPSVTVTSGTTTTSNSTNTTSSSSSTAASINSFEASLIQHKHSKNFSMLKSSSKVSRKRTAKHHHHNHQSNKVRKFRSRSLPNISFSSRSFEAFYPLELTSSGTTTSTKSNKTSSSSKIPAPLPPVNIQSLKEIDLSEILRNPQLRHDILFDPQLQFRPNLDGERGRRKKITYDKYWSGVCVEVEAYAKDYTTFNKTTSRLPNLFNTLREILISLLPSKDKQLVVNILDLDLIIQQLSKNSLDFIGLSKWLAEVFKSHCAPMRDSWVDDMLTLFQQADEEKSVLKLVDGLRLIFTILEAMKLDMANHQIRMLRPVLIQTAVDFERDYFTQMISRCKLDISDSIHWFKRNHIKESSLTPKKSTLNSVLSLLSCSNMVSEFPSSLSFDHARLIVLRANVRQNVCLQLCLALYKQLVFKLNINANDRTNLIQSKNLNQLKREILGIITDDNGNVKWTRNIGSISLQLTRRAMLTGSIKPNEKDVQFAFNWLIKQTQPNSQVYSLMEQRVFNQLKTKIEELEKNDVEKLTNLINASTTGNGGGVSNQLNGSISTLVSGSSTTSSSSISNSTINNEESEDEDGLNDIANRIALLIRFHWDVFGSYYVESLEMK